FRRNNADASGIAARSRQTADEPGRERIVADGNNRDSAAGCLSYFGWPIAECSNDIDVCAYQIGRVVSQLFLPSLGVAELDRNVLTLDIALPPKPLSKRFHTG